MALFRRKPKGKPISREDSLATRPVLNRLVRLEEGEDGNTILCIPRRQTAMFKAVSKWYHISPYKKVALDELGSFVIELCDGNHTVAEIVEKFAERFRLNRREAEVAMGAFLRDLAGRSVIGLVIDREDN